VCFYLTLTSSYHTRKTFNRLALRPLTGPMLIPELTVRLQSPQVQYSPGSIPARGTIPSQVTAESYAINYWIFVAVGCTSGYKSSVGTADQKLFSIHYNYVFMVRSVTSDWRNGDIIRGRRRRSVPRGVELWLTSRPRSVPTSTTLERWRLTSTRSPSCSGVWSLSRNRSAKVS